jgi:phosphoribosylformylglycinamidine cyclo-ligase
VLPKGLGARIDLTKVNAPPVFRWLAQVGNIAPHEMLRTFNCGVGMIVVVAPKDAAAVADAFAQAGEKVATIGSVIRADGSERVVYDGTLDLKL